MVRRREEGTILTGGLNMLHLKRRGCNMGFSCGREILRPRPRHNSARPAIIADVVDRLIYNNILDIDISNIYVRNVVDGAIIKEISVIPVPALVTNAGITKSISYTPIESDVWRPVAFVINVCAVTPSPISWRPKQSRVRREDPSARDPIILVAIPRPIAWRPHEVRPGDRRLVVDRQRGRRDLYTGNGNLRICGRRKHR
jgi:hypothetical protein